MKEIRVNSMKWSALLLLGLAGCTNAPVADLMDRFYPGEIEPGPLHGGVKTVVSTPDPPLNVPPTIPPMPATVGQPPPPPAPR